MSYPGSSQSVGGDIHRSARFSRNSRAAENASDNPEAIFESLESRQRYEAFSRLQAGAVAFGERLPIPEIVAIGGQSDGKSSLLEALLGFRFNVREVEMGTRRPLILQMVHDPSAMEPRCRLQDEDSDDYGPPIDPPSAVAEAIRTRTDAHLKKLTGGQVVSPIPIVMRAEYAYSPNLTIIDSPGFIINARKGDPENTPEEIMRMVKDLISPPHRIILFLQQSSVEWVSSLWLDVVKEIDPSFRRTIVVSSKFDNRLKEFAERWEVDRYLSANGVLGEGVHPFFVALPKDRMMTSNADFRRQISVVDTEILRHLRESVSGGFDEARFGEQIGFGNLRRFLEHELQRRYRDAAPGTLALLERRCAEVDDELARAEARLATAGDVAGLRKMAMVHSAAITRHLVALIDGSSDPDPEAWGRTSEEEREDSGVGKWPGIPVNGPEPPKPANSSLRLYGGAAFERVLDEFRCAACALDCPFVSREKVANILLAHSGKQGGPVAAANEIARQSARATLAPLLDALCDRLAYVLRWLFDVALHRMRMEVEATPGASEPKLMESTLDAYVAFHACLRRAHHRFVAELAAACKDRARHHLTTVTSSFSHTEAWEVNLATPQMAQIGEAYAAAPYEVDSANLDAATPPQEPPSVKANGGVNGGSPPEEGSEQQLAREAALTVPETPSPEQGNADPAAGRRREVSRSGLGQSSAASSAAANGADLNGILRRFNAASLAEGPGAQRRRAAGLANGGAAAGRISANGRAPHKHPGVKSMYSDVCSLVAEQFCRIREILVNRMVPTTLSAGFLTPCRERLSIAVAVELFAVTDDEFMEMFAAPGAIEGLRGEKVSLEKRSENLHHCVGEFRALARSL